MLRETNEEVHGEIVDFVDGVVNAKGYRTRRRVHRGDRQAVVVRGLVPLGDHELQRQGRRRRGHVWCRPGYDCAVARERAADVARPLVRELDTGVSASVTTAVTPTVSSSDANCAGSRGPTEPCTTIELIAGGVFVTGVGATNVNAPRTVPR